MIRDAHVIRLIEHVGEHYRLNISNRFIRPALLQLPIEKHTWDLMEDLTEKIDQYTYQGFHLDELYRQIIATARFISITRKELGYSLRSRLSNNSVGADRVLHDMAVNNFASNIQLFADLVNELFLDLVEVDKVEAKGRRPLFTTIPELQNIGRMLVGG